MAMVYRESYLQMVNEPQTGLTLPTSVAEGGGEIRSLPQSQVPSSQPPKCFQCSKCPSPDLTAVITAEASDQPLPVHICCGCSSMPAHPSPQPSPLQDPVPTSARLAHHRFGITSSVLRSFRKGQMRKASCRLCQRYLCRPSRHLTGLLWPSL